MDGSKLLKSLKKFWFLAILLLPMLLSAQNEPTNEELPAPAEEPPATEVQDELPVEQDQDLVSEEPEISKEKIGNKDASEERSNFLKNRVQKLRQQVKNQPQSDNSVDSSNQETSLSTNPSLPQTPDNSQTLGINQNSVSNSDSNLSSNQNSQTPTPAPAPASTTTSSPTKDPSVAADTQVKPTTQERTPEDKAKDFIEEIKVLKPSESTAGSDVIPEGQELVSLHFPEPTDIKDIITAVSLWTGKNVILDDSAVGSSKIRMISPKKITKVEAYQAFLSALSLLGLTTVETGKVIKIIRTNQVNNANIKTFVGSNWTPMTDEYITQIIPLKYVKVTDIQMNLSKIMTSTYVIYEPTNTLIVSDSGYKIKKLMEILSYLDTPSNQPKLTVVPVKYSDVKTVVSNLSSMGVSSGQNKILPDDRTNTILVFGNSAFTKRVKDLVEAIDVKMDDNINQANIHVRPLSYVDATKLASTLSQLITGNKKSGVKSSLSTSSSSSSPSIVTLDDDVKITADETSNSLIISGSRGAYDSVNNLIKKLDVKRSQVFVEAEIIDMNLDGKLNYGSSIFLGSGGSKTNLAYTWEAGAMAPLIESTITGSTTTTSVSKAAGTFADDLVVGVLLNKTVKVPGLGEISPGALIKMIKTDSHSNVLSSPHILTANNEQASITVGDTIYFKGSSVVSSTGVVTQNLDKENVDLELTLTPKISPTNYITLDMNLSSNTAKIDSVAQAPTIMKRKTTQKITVKNGQTVVISGLVKEGDMEVNRKIPFLGDIPIIGWLFRNSTIQKTKGNLMVFLTPHIVHGANDLAVIYEKKVKERDEFLNLVYGNSYQDQDLYKKLATAEDGKFKEDAFSHIEDVNRKTREEEMLQDMGYTNSNNSTSSSEVSSNVLDQNGSLTEPQGTTHPLPENQYDPSKVPSDVIIEAVPDTPNGLELQVDEEKK